MVICVGRGREAAVPHCTAEGKARLVGVGDLVCGSGVELGGLTLGLGLLLLRPLAGPGGLVLIARA